VCNCVHITVHLIAHIIHQCSTNTCTRYNVCPCVALHNQYQHLYSLQCVPVCRSAHSVPTHVLTAVCACVSLCTLSTNTCTHCNVCLCVALHTQYQHLYSLQCVSVCRSAHPVPTPLLTTILQQYAFPLCL